MLVSGASMARACGAAIPFCGGPYVLTPHMFASIHFASVHLPKLVLSKFIAPSLSCPLVSIIQWLYVVSIIYFYSQHFHSIIIPPDKIKMLPVGQKRKLGHPKCL